MSLNILSMKYLNKIKFFSLFVLLCAIFFLLFFFSYKLFLIKDLQIVSSKQFEPVNKGRLINRSLLLVNEGQIAKEIIRENFLIKAAIVEKVWPNKLKITVVFYEPCASLLVNNGFFILSCDGRILQKTKDALQYLPVINYYQKLNSRSFQTGSWVDYKDIKRALFFIVKLKEINLTPLTIDIRGQDMLVFKLIGSQQIIFSNSKDKNIQDYQLKLIVKQFKIEGREFKKVDLRFDKPIIEF